MSLGWRPTPSPTIREDKYKKWLSSYSCQWWIESDENRGMRCSCTSLHFFSYLIHPTFYISVHLLKMPAPASRVGRRSLSPLVRKQLDNLDKDAESRKSAMKLLKSFVEDLDSKSIPFFLAEVSQENGSNLTSREYAISLLKFLPDFIDELCLRIAGPLQDNTTQTNCHMGLAMTLAARNNLLIEAYVISIIRSGMEMLVGGSKEVNLHKRLTTFQMIKCLMRTVDSRSFHTELERIIYVLHHCELDRMECVRGAANEALMVAKNIRAQLSDGKLNYEPGKKFASQKVG